MNLAFSDIRAQLAAPGKAVELALVLLDGFALMSYAAIVEPLRAANTLVGRECFRWVHVSLDGRPVRASNGATLLAERGLDGLVDAEFVIVFAAGDPRALEMPGLPAWLRRHDRAGKVVGAVSAAPYLLARAGLLAGRRATIHWDHRDAFEQDFPDIDHVGELFVRDGRTITCAGGMAGMDLAAWLIQQRAGPDLAARVAAWFIHPGTRPADRPQLPDLAERYRSAGPRVLRTLAAMERSLDEPLPRESLARIAGTTLRQIERLFAREVGEGVAAHYLRLRLERAAHLLRTTGQPITEVAMATGFRSSSYFSRAFRVRFGVAPSAARRAQITPPGTSHSH